MCCAQGLDAPQTSSIRKWRGPVEGSRPLLPDTKVHCPNLDLFTSKQPPPPTNTTLIFEASKARLSSGNTCVFGQYNSNRIVLYPRDFLISGRGQAADQPPSDLETKRDPRQSLRPPISPTALNYRQPNLPQTHTHTHTNPTPKMSWYSNIASRVNNSVTTLSRNLLNSEADGDTEDDTHVCRVLRQYYATEKPGAGLPAWLPPDPKAPPPVAVQQQASAVPSRYGAAGGLQASPSSGLSSLWDKNRGASPAAAGPRNPFATGGARSPADPAGGGMVRPPLPGSAARVGGSGGTGSYGGPPTAGSIQDRLKGRLGGGARTVSPGNSGGGPFAPPPAPPVRGSSGSGDYDPYRAGGGYGGNNPYASSGGGEAAGGSSGGRYGASGGGGLPSGPRRMGGLPSGPRTR